MAWFREKWKLVENLLYREHAPSTFAKYYLYYYLVEDLGLQELKPEFVELERALYDATTVYLFWFTVEKTSDLVTQTYNPVVITQNDIRQAIRCGLPVRHDLSEGKIYPTEIHRDDMTYTIPIIPDEIIYYFLDDPSYLNNNREKIVKNECIIDLIKRILCRADPTKLRFLKILDYCIRSSILPYAPCKFSLLEWKVDLLDKIVKSIKDLLEIVYSLEPIVHKFEIAYNGIARTGEVIYNLFKEYDNITPRIFIDTFLGIEHCTAQILIHNVIPWNSKEASWLASIMFYIRNGNIYALYDFLVNFAKERLPYIVHKYAPFLPGSRFYIIE